MKRLFIAIRLIPKGNTLVVYNSLRKALDYNKIRWVDPDKLHLTLKFIGSTPQEDIPTIIEVIKKTAKDFSPIEFELNKIGIFGSSYNPKVIWLGINNNMQLENLGSNMLDNFNSAGFPRGRQNFVPHITIGRITKIVDKQLFNTEISKVNQLFLQKSTVNKIILFESVLTKKAPVYKEVFSVQL